MKQNISELVRTLSDKGALLKKLLGLLEKEQSCMVSLDLDRLEENQHDMVAAMERMAQLSEKCQAMIACIGKELGLSDNTTLSPIITRLPQAEQRVLREAQGGIATDSRALQSALALHRGLIEDSLNVVHGSVTFFNRLFNPGDTYGVGGSLVSRRGGSRFVCKEV